jgi:arsenical pump membrane protein
MERRKQLPLDRGHTPRLLDWLAQYGAPSLLSIVVTYLVLRWTQRANLEQDAASDPPRPELSTSGKIAAFGIAGASVALLACSALDVQLGFPTAIAGAAIWALVLILASTVASILDQISR